MRAYNVEIYDRKIRYRSHTNVTFIDYLEDYLSPETNSIIVEKIDVDVGDFIRIENGANEFVGIVSSVTSENEETLTIAYKSFLTLFDLSILFDTKLQSSKNTQTLEDYIATVIHNNFGINSDQSMNLPYMASTITSSTSKWNFGYDSDEDNSHYCILNLLKHILIPALEKYSIRVTASIDVADKVVRFTIGKNTSSKITIEADLPNIVKKNVIVQAGDTFVNKVVVYNSENYVDNIIYYRHPDNTFNTQDTNRIIPVVQEMYATSPIYDGDEVVETFAERALDQAIEAFSVVEYNNLIELTMSPDDELYKPMNLEVGQIVNIISDDKQYSSILTGKRLGDSMTLIFGKIRVDLTKKIWRSSYGY